jgi:cold shock protein
MRARRASIKAQLRHSASNRRLAEFGFAVSEASTRQFPNLRCIEKRGAPLLRAGTTKDWRMNSGTVKFYNGTKGFGFIETGDGGKDVFVHVSALERAGISSLVEGQKLEFELEKDRQGRNSASNLRLL